MDLVEFSYHKPSKIKRLCGIGGGIQEVVSQVTDKLMIDGKELKDIEIEFGDIREELGIDGFIGNDVLRCFTMTVNYREHTIQLSE